MRNRRPRAGRPMTGGGARGERHTWLAVTALVTAAGLALYCLTRQPPERAPVEVTFGCDTSQSLTEKERRGLFGPWDQIIDGCLPTGARVNVWFFDYDVSWICDRRPTAARDLWRVQELWAERIPAKRETHPEKMLRRFHEQVSRAGGDTKAALVLFWDGDGVHRVGEYPTELAELDNIQAVWVIGVATESEASTDLRLRIAEVFSPLGERLIVSNQYDLREGLDDFQQLLLKGGEER